MKIFFPDGTTKEGTVEEILEYIRTSGNNPFEANKTSINNKDISTRTQPEAEDDESSDGEYFIGSYCKYYTLKQLRRKSEERWLKEMTDTWYDVTDHDYNDQTIKAWKDCFNVIQESLVGLPTIYNDTYAIFEYVVPRPVSGNRTPESGIRADVVLVAGKKTVILEFKRAKYYQDKHINQVLRYKKGIERYHKQFEEGDFWCKPVLVLTWARNVYEREKGVIVCSKDNLQRAIIETLGKKVRVCHDIDDWIDGFNN